MYQMFIPSLCARVPFISWLSEIHLLILSSGRAHGTSSPWNCVYSKPFACQLYTWRTALLNIKSLACISFLTYLAAAAALSAEKSWDPLVFLPHISGLIFFLVTLCLIINRPGLVFLGTHNAFQEFLYLHRLSCLFCSCGLVLFFENSSYIYWFSFV